MPFSPQSALCHINHQDYVDSDIEDAYQNLNITVIGAQKAYILDFSA